MLATTADIYQAVFEPHSAVLVSSCGRLALAGTLLTNQPKLGWLQLHRLEVRLPAG